MKARGLTGAVFFAFACTGANAQSAQQEPAADSIAGCVDRVKAEKYISEHNYAELLRGTEFGWKDTWGLDERQTGSHHRLRQTS